MSGFVKENSSTKCPHLIASYIEIDGVYEEKIQPNNGQVMLEGPMVKMMQVLSERVPFTYTLIKSMDGQYGIELKNNGTWTGMIGQVMRGEADIAVGPFTQTYLRRKAVDFTDSFNIESAAILTGQQRDDGSGSVEDVIFNIIKPEWKVWALLFTSGIIAVAIASIADNFIGNATFPARDANERTFWADASKYALIVFGMQTQAGPDFNSRRGVTRTVILSFVMAAMFFNIFVNSEFTTDIVSSAPVKYIESRSELVKSKKVKPCVQDGSSFQDLFRSSSSGVYAEIWQRIQSEKPDDVIVTNSQLMTREFLEKIAAGTHAYMYYEFDLIVIGNAACLQFPNTRLHLSNEKFFTNTRTIAMRKNLDPELKERINDVIRHVYESGIFSQWWNDASFTNNTCFEAASSATPDAEEATPDPFAVKNMEILLAVLFCGEGAAVLVAIAEYSHGKSRSPTREKSRRQPTIKSGVTTPRAGRSQHINCTRQKVPREHILQ